MLPCHAPIVLFYVVLIGYRKWVEGAISSNTPLATANYSLVCSEAVNYDFYYPNTMTLGTSFLRSIICNYYTDHYWQMLATNSFFFHYLDDLNQQAFALLDGVPYEFLPNACMVDIKKMLCACKYRQKLKIYSLLPLLSIDSSLLFSLNYIFLYTIYDKLLTLKSLYLILTQTTHFFMLLPPQPYT